MDRRTTKGVLALSLASVMACSGDGATSSEGIAFRAAGLTDDSGHVTFMDDGQNLYTLTSGQMYVEEFELEFMAGQGCDDLNLALLDPRIVCDSDDNVDDDDGEDELKIRGPFVVDLLSGSVTPDLSDLVIPAGTYKALEIKVDDGDPDDGLISQDHVLNDRSFVVSASFEYQGASASLQLYLDFSEDIEIEPATGIVIGSDAARLIVEFAATNWLQGLNIGTCLDRDDLSLSEGVLVIDDDSGKGDCSDIENQIKDNMKGSGDIDDDNHEDDHGGSSSSDDDAGVDDLNDDHGGGNDDVNDDH